MVSQGFLQIFDSILSTMSDIAGLKRIHVSQ